MSSDLYKCSFEWSSMITVIAKKKKKNRKICYQKRINIHTTIYTDRYTEKKIKNSLSKDMGLNSKKVQNRAIEAQ